MTRFERLASRARANLYAVSPLPRMVWWLGVGIVATVAAFLGPLFAVMLWVGITSVFFLASYHATMMLKDEARP